MQVQVILWGQIKQKAGRDRLELALEEGATAADAVRGAAEAMGPEAAAVLQDEQGNISPSILVSLNGDHVRNLDDAALSDGAEISLMSPIAGG